MTQRTWEYQGNQARPAGAARAGVARICAALLALAVLLAAPQATAQIRLP
ncbi:MAG TPA: hypothetical protein VHG28_10940 [Longimicrobiaceae bacterium]|nr:hypothetical protein [Longimicrobiaceae bacterium]